MRALFALAGLHKYDRGAEVALISVAKELARAGHKVTLIGSGDNREATPYQFLHANSVARENFNSFPSIPIFRNEYAYEEFTFIPDFLRQYRPSEYDVTLTCGYPFTNWALRHPVMRGRRPPHIFITENGDWPAYSNKSEYRYFGCEGLVCTNPDFFERNKDHWNCRLIPNGVDCELFKPGSAQREHFGIPSNRLIVLMVSALIPTKRVEAGIDAVSRIPGAHLVIAGNGPLQHMIKATAARLLPDRFTLLSVPTHQMPALYQSADVFLHLSKDESFGNVFLEAMACGLPVVGHDSPRLRWIVGDDEFLVDTEDLAAVAKAINTANKSPIAKQQQRVAKAAAFSWILVGKLYQDFIEAVIAQY